MRRERAVTLQDIADRLGVSRSTASFAITGRGRVSEDMRRRVHEVAAELGYRPNTVARHLKGSRTGMLALRLPPDSTTLSYYMEATFGIVEEANRAGMTVIMLPTEQSADHADQLPADAVILLDPDLNDPVVHTLLAGRLPVITGEPVPPGLPEPRAWVTSEHAPAVRELMDHLLERGVHRPAMLFPELTGYWALTVREAFEAWCAEHGMRPRITQVEHPAPPEIIHAAVAELLTGDDEDPVDAIVSVSDGTVLSVVTSAQQLGRRVGADLLVAALVDTEVLSLTRPSITAIDLHPREFGRRCVRAALAVLDEDGDAAAIREVVPITVHHRASTRGDA